MRTCVFCWLFKRGTRTIRAIAVAVATVTETETATADTASKRDSIEYAVFYLNRSCYFRGISLKFKEQSQKNISRSVQRSVAYIRAVESVQFQDFGLRQRLLGLKCCLEWFHSVSHCQCISGYFE